MRNYKLSSAWFLCMVTCLQRRKIKGCLKCLRSNKYLGEKLLSIITLSKSQDEICPAATKVINFPSETQRQIDVEIHICTYTSICVYVGNIYSRCTSNKPYTRNARFNSGHENCKICECVCTLCMKFKIACDRLIVIYIPGNTVFWDRTWNIPILI